MGLGVSLCVTVRANCVLLELSVFVFMLESIMKILIQVNKKVLVILTFCTSYNYVPHCILTISDITVAVI